jgi:hypothetical protein
MRKLELTKHSTWALQSLSSSSKGWFKVCFDLWFEFECFNLFVHDVEIYSV